MNWSSTTSTFDGTAAGSALALARAITRRRRRREGTRDRGCRATHAVAHDRGARGTRAPRRAAVRALLTTTSCSPTIRSQTMAVRRPDETTTEGAWLPCAARVRWRRRSPRGRPAAPIAREPRSPHGPPSESSCSVTLTASSILASGIAVDLARRAPPAAPAAAPGSAGAASSTDGARARRRCEPPASPRSESTWRGPRPDQPRGPRRRSPVRPSTTPASARTSASVPPWTHLAG